MSSTADKPEPQSESPAESDPRTVHARKRGRPYNVLPSVRWRADIREDLAAEVELLLMDPFLDRVRYGARNELINKLLAEWVKKQKRAKEPNHG